MVRQAAAPLPQLPAGLRQVRVCGKPAQAAEPAAPLSAGAAIARLEAKARERAELLVHAAEVGVDELRLLDEPRAHRVNAVLRAGAPRSTRRSNAGIWRR